MNSTRKPTPDAVKKAMAKHMAKTAAVARTLKSKKTTPSQYVRTVAGTDKPVYPGSKGPFQSNSWQGYEGGPVEEIFAGAAARPFHYVPTQAGLDKPVYGCSKGPFQSRSWEGYNGNPGVDVGIVGQPPLLGNNLRSAQTGCACGGQSAIQSHSLARAALDQAGRSSAVFTPSQYYYAGGPIASPAYQALPVLAPRVNSYAALY